MKGYVIAIASCASLFWGLSFPITIIGLNTISPLLLALWRYALATPLFLITLLAIHGRKGLKIYPHIGIFLLLGLFGVAIPISLQNIGMVYTSAPISSILQSTGPLFTVILAASFLNEPLTKKKASGILLASLGTILALNVKNPGAGSLMGNIMVLFSAISYSIGGIIAKYCLNKGYQPIQLIAFSSLSGTCFLLIVTSFVEKLTISFSFNSWMMILFLAIFPTFISFIFWYTAMKKMEVSRLSFFIYLIPVFATLFSYILLKQHITWVMILSGILIIIGVAIAQTHRNLNESAINKYDAGKVN
ncbi:MAG: DMT family transporter [Thermoplasmata archaeon]|nr:MAG: DMT family transporter [Thermoplasmata archaeon]